MGARLGQNYNGGMWHILTFHIDLHSASVDTNWMLAGESRTSSNIIM